MCKSDGGCAKARADGTGNRNFAFCRIDLDARQAATGLCSDCEQRSGDLSRVGIEESVDLWIFICDWRQPVAFSSHSGFLCCGYRIREVLGS